MPVNTLAFSPFDLYKQGSNFMGRLLGGTKVNIADINKAAKANTIDIMCLFSSNVPLKVQKKVTSAILMKTHLTMENVMNTFLGADPKETYRLLKNTLTNATRDGNAFNQSGSFVSRFSEEAQKALNEELGVPVEIVFNESVLTEAQGNRNNRGGGNSGGFRDRFGNTDPDKAMSAENFMRDQDARRQAERETLRHQHEQEREERRRHWDQIRTDSRNITDTERERIRTQQRDREHVRGTVLQQARDRDHAAHVARQDMLNRSKLDFQRKQYDDRQTEKKLEQAAQLKVKVDEFNKQVNRGVEFGNFTTAKGSSTDKNFTAQASFVFGIQGIAGDYENQVNVDLKFAFTIRVNAVIVESDKLMEGIGEVNGRDTFYNYLKFRAGSASFFKDVVFNLGALKRMAQRNTSGKLEDRMLAQMASGSNVLLPNFVNDMMEFKKFVVVMTLDDADTLKNNYNLSVYRSGDLHRIFEGMHILSLVILDVQDEQNVPATIFDSDRPNTALSFRLKGDDDNLDKLKKLFSGVMR